MMPCQTIGREWAKMREELHVALITKQIAPGDAAALDCLITMAWAGTDLPPCARWILASAAHDLAPEEMSR